jgi:hypothetical protein
MPALQQSELSEEQFKSVFLKGLVYLTRQDYSIRCGIGPARQGSKTAKENFLDNREASA